MTIAEQAAQRVAEGTSSTVESAEWSIRYQAGYGHGRSDALNGAMRSLEGAEEAYRAGFERGYRWTRNYREAAEREARADMPGYLDNSASH